MKILIFSKNKKFQYCFSSGFTLVEMMVSLTIFSIVMTVGVGSLFILINSNSKAQALYSSTINLSFALDTIGREIRTGYKYYCSPVVPPSNVALPLETDDCTDGKFIAFTRERDGARVGYLVKGDTDGVSRLWQKIKFTDGRIIDWIPVTSNDLSIDLFQLDVQNTPSVNDDEYAQPEVTLKVKGSVIGGHDTNTVFNIQSRIIQYRLDIVSGS